MSQRVKHEEQELCSYFTPSSSFPGPCLSPFTTGWGRAQERGWRMCVGEVSFQGLLEKIVEQGSSRTSIGCFSRKVTKQELGETGVRHRGLGQRP